MIKSLRLEVTESGKLRYGTSYPSRYTERSTGEFIDCHNPVCYGGGVRVGLILSGMVDKREAEPKTVVRCIGYEGSPKGRRRYGPCPNSFELKFCIEYNA